MNKIKKLLIIFFLIIFAQQVPAKDPGISLAFTCIVKVKAKNPINNFLILFILIFNVPNNYKSYDCKYQSTCS